MSRIPRSQEHLKTGATAEAVTAARFRAYAARADRDGQPNLASAWRALAEEKDALAQAALEAAGQVRGAALDLAAALSDERYENEVLYPKMLREVEGSAAEVLGAIVERQRAHLARLTELRDRYNAAPGDVAA